MGILHRIKTKNEMQNYNEGNTTTVKHVQFLMDSFELTPSQSAAARLLRQAEHLSS